MLADIGHPVFLGARYQLHCKKKRKRIVERGELSRTRVANGETRSVEARARHLARAPSAGRSDRPRTAAGETRSQPLRMILGEAAGRWPAGTTVRAHVSVQWVWSFVRTCEGTRFLSWVVALESASVIPATSRRGHVPGRRVTWVM
jgi:hypothetical protein